MSGDVIGELFPFETPPMHEWRLLFEFEFEFFAQTTTTPRRPTKKTPSDIKTNEYEYEETQSEHE